MPRACKEESNNDTACALAAGIGQARQQPAVQPDGCVDRDAALWLSRPGSDMRDRVLRVFLIDQGGSVRVRVASWQSPTEHPAAHGVRA
jgi:hypothetical protein